MIIPPERVQGHLTFQFVRPPDRRVTIDSALLESTDDVIITVHELSPSRPLVYGGVTVLDAGYWAVWFLFKHRPFDVGRVYRPDGTWTGYYVDILEPVRWVSRDAATLEEIVDLFLDLWIAPDGGSAILDEDEFEEARRLGHLTPRQVSHARSTLQDLVAATRRGAFPPTMVKEFQAQSSKSGR